MTDLTAAPPLPFIVTKEHRRFVEFCDACRRYRYIGLCYGPPGVGKTLSARQYTQWQLVEQAAPRHQPGHALPPELAACHTLFYTAPVAGTPGRVTKEIFTAWHQLNLLVQEATTHQLPPGEEIPWYKIPECVELLIVDESDRLQVAGLEALRDIYDRRNIGLILIGMPGIEKRLARYAQLYSRVGFVHQFRTLSTEELRWILEQRWQQLGLSLDYTDFTDAEAVATIIRITNGNFRLVHRLLTQVERILQINHLQLITKEVVEAARERLVIGVM
jgi:DNA transposition AAA+ family ATPase